MKKTISLIITIVLICTSVVGCQENNRNTNQEKYMQFLMMRIMALEALWDLIDSNENIMDALYCENMQETIDYTKKALNLLYDAEKKIKDVISSPNFIEEEIVKLQENYKKTIELFEKFSNLSSKEEKQLDALMSEGTQIHLYLLKSCKCFVNLYFIRKFDSLPDEEAKEQLQETWLEFGFEDNIECPDSIDEQKLYIIWAKQFAGEEVSKDTIKTINELRKNDDLSSKKYNKKWADLIQEICSTNNWDESNPSYFFL